MGYRYPARLRLQGKSCTLLFLFPLPDSDRHMIRPEILWCSFSSSLILISFLNLSLFIRHYDNAQIVLMIVYDIRRSCRDNRLLQIIVVNA